MLGRFRLRRSLEGRDTPESPSRFGPPGLVARRAALRAGQPLSVPAEQRDRLLAAALADVSRGGRIDALATHRLPADEITEVATDVGPLLMHEGDEVMTPAIREEGVWEKEEAAWLRRVVQPGAAALDVGANVGYFTLLIAQLAGPDGAVVAVEPETRNLGLLRANLWRHGLDDVAVLPIAGWSSRTLLPLVFSEVNRGDHQVRPDRADAAAQLVPAGPLDELLGEHAVLDVVKVDTQGVDHEVIAGLRTTLARSPDPQVLVEYWLEGMEDRGIDPREVLGGYRGLGFELALLGDDGTATAATDDEVIAACEAWAGRFVNLVLHRPGSLR
ncbi:MAG: FkbM family methyltransferase [Solirubrobacteraceae bacterium]|nr:FkbM family methyltransferase [Solirubrobacteraceae bacterium]